MRVSSISRSDNKSKRCYFNTFEDAGDYFRGLKFVQRDLNSMDQLITLDKVSFVIFYILSHRNLPNVYDYLYRIRKELVLINLNELTHQFDDYLDSNRQSIMITYLSQAIKEVMSWSELKDNEYDELIEFLENVGKRII